MLGAAETGRPTAAPLDYAGPASARPGWRMPWWAACLVALGVLLLLGALLVPSLGRPRRQALRIACAANLRSVGQAVHIYAQDHGGAFPDKLGQVVAGGYVRDMRMLLCPACDDTPAQGATPAAWAADLTTGGHLSYVYTGRGLTVHADPYTVIAYEPPTNHERDDKPAGGNVMFADGHAEWWTPAQLRHLADRFAAGERPVVVGMPPAGRTTTQPTTARLAP